MSSQFGMDPVSFPQEVLHSPQQMEDRPESSSSIESTSASSSCSNMSGDAVPSIPNEGLDGVQVQSTEELNVMKIGLDRTRRRNRSTSTNSRMQLEAGPQLLDFSEPLPFGNNNNNNNQHEEEGDGIRLLTPPGDVPAAELEPVPVHSAMSLRSLMPAGGVVNQLGLETPSLNQSKAHCCSTHGHTYNCTRQATHNISLESLDLESNGTGHHHGYGSCCFQSNNRYKSGITISRGSCQCFHQ